MKYIFYYKTLKKLQLGYLNENYDLAQALKS